MLLWTGRGRKDPLGTPWLQSHYPGVGGYKHLSIDNYQGLSSVQTRTNPHDLMSPHFHLCQTSSINL